MSSSQERYEKRMVLQPGAAEVSKSTYNAIIGGVLLYGFIADAIIVALFKNKAIEMILNNPGGYSTTLIVMMVIYAICCLAGTFMVNRSDNPVVSFIGFNLFAIPIGFVLAYGTIPFYNGGSVAIAFALTAVITLAMLVISTIFPDTFLSMGTTLFISLLVCVIVDLLALFIFKSDLIFIDYIVTFIFSLFIGYDWARANRCAKTIDNAVDCAAELYLDMINLFIRILSIVGRRD